MALRNQLLYIAGFSINYRIAYGFTSFNHDSNGCNECQSNDSQSTLANVDGLDLIDDLGERFYTLNLSSQFPKLHVRHTGLFGSYDCSLSSIFWYVVMGIGAGSVFV